MYFASQGLKGRETVVWRSLDECPIKQWDFENDYVKIAEFSTDDVDKINQFTLLGK